MPSPGSGVVAYHGCTWLMLLQFIWLFSVITLGPVTYGNYQYPQWAIAMGWSIGVCSIIPIPAYAIYKIATTEGPIKEVGGIKQE